MSPSPSLPRGHAASNPETRTVHPNQPTPPPRHPLAAGHAATDTRPAGRLAPRRLSEPYRVALDAVAQLRHKADSSGDPTASQRSPSPLSHAKARPALTVGLPGGRADRPDSLSDGPSATPETPGPTNWPEGPSRPCRLAPIRPKRGALEDQPIRASRCPTSGRSEGGPFGALHGGNWQPYRPWAPVEDGSPRETGHPFGGSGRGSAVRDATARVTRPRAGCDRQSGSPAINASPGSGSETLAVSAPRSGSRLYMASPSARSSAFGVGSAWRSPPLEMLGHTPSGLHARERGSSGLDWPRASLREVRP